MEEVPELCSSMDQGGAELSQDLLVSCPASRPTQSLSSHSFRLMILPSQILQLEDQQKLLTFPHFSHFWNTSGLLTFMFVVLFFHGR